MKQCKLTSLIFGSLSEDCKHVSSPFDGIFHGMSVMSEVNQSLLIVDIFIFVKHKGLQLKIGY